MNNNLDIFICTNKNFNIYPKNKAYKIITTDDFYTDIPLEIIKCDSNKDSILKKEHGYSEGARYHYVWKNYELKDYVGTAHYRRYFEFMDNIPDLDDVFSKSEIIVPLGAFFKANLTILRRCSLLVNGAFHLGDLAGTKTTSAFNFNDAYIIKRRCPL